MINGWVLGTLLAPQRLVLRVASSKNYGLVLRVASSKNYGLEARARSLVSDSDGTKGNKWTNTVVGNSPNSFMGRKSLKVWF